MKNRPSNLGSHFEDCSTSVGDVPADELLFKSVQAAVGTNNFKKARFIINAGLGVDSCTKRQMSAYVTRAERDNRLGCQK